MMAELPLHVERLNAGRPILQKLPSSPWQNRVTFNPACTLVTNRDELASIVPKLPFDRRTRDLLLSQTALCFLFYRAQGGKTDGHDYTCSSIGLAVLSSDLRLLARHREPILHPDQTYDNLGVEDPRVTKVNDLYIMLYTAYSRGNPKNKIRIAVASTTDLIHWSKHGLLKGDFNTIDNKNAMLFEKKINDKFVMLHRPMEGREAMSIHWATGNDVFSEWKTCGVLMKPVPDPSFIDTWIGGGAPPLQLSDRYHLIIYHVGHRKADDSREYDLGIAVADFSTREIIVRRIEPFLRPETPSETTGDGELGVNNVLFLCGAYFYNGYVYFPYAGADTVVLGGRLSRAELDRFLKLKL